MYACDVSAMRSRGLSACVAGCLIRQITNAALDILKADELVRVNQDLLGIPGDLIWKQGSNEVQRAAMAAHALHSNACLAWPALSDLSGSCC
jgi:hypothetical protein